MSKSAYARYESSSSNQAPSRHIVAFAYCCSVPRLTRFTKNDCVRPGSQHYPFCTGRTRRPLDKAFTLAIADCKYRAPLPPRLV